MDELQTYQSLLDELLGGIQSVIQSGETLTDEFQGVLAQELEFLTSTIDQLIAKNATMGEVVPPLTSSQPSSVINAFKYDPKNQKLFVQFKGKFPNDQGHVYAYGGVPPDIVSLFQRGAIPAKTRGRNMWGSWWEGKHPSMGSSMNVLLKGLGYPYQKIS